MLTLARPAIVGFCFAVSPARGKHAMQVVKVGDWSHLMSQVNRSQVAGFWVRPAEAHPGETWGWWAGYSTSGSALRK